MSHLLIVEARFYDELADALLAGAKAALDAAGATYDVVTVPGALEIPAAIMYGASRKGLGFASTKKPYEGFVALGCVIRGETHHFDIVANESARAIMDLTIGRGLAIGNGILTTENDQQAWVRARPGEGGDKGGFAARAALTMIDLREKLA